MVRVLVTFSWLERAPGARGRRRRAARALSEFMHSKKYLCIEICACGLLSSPLPNEHAPSTQRSGISIYSAVFALWDAPIQRLGVWRFVAQHKPGPSTARSGEWPAWFFFWFSGCWRALAKGTAWAGFPKAQFIIIIIISCSAQATSFRKATWSSPHDRNWTTPLVVLEPVLEICPLREAR